MTATDELRRLLDERGVKYEKAAYVIDALHRRAEETSWEVDDTLCEFTEYPAGSTKLEVYYITPEQAIAATLGTPISADLRTALDFMRIWITDDAHLGESAISRELEKAEGLRKLDAIEQAITATLGSDDDYEAKMDALLCRLTNGKWSKSRAYDLNFMVSCVEEEYEKAYAEELAATTQGSDREAELEALAKDLYANAVDFNFKGWMPIYEARFAALGIEVEQ